MLGRNNFGMSMIEVMMAMGLLGGLTVAGMQMFKTQNQNQKTIEKKYETVTILSSIRSLLSEPDNCTETFRGINPSSFSPSRLRKKTASGFEDVYELNVQLPGDIRIKSYLFNKAYPGLASDEAVLRINYDLGKAVLRENTQNILKIHYTLDPDTLLLASCYALNTNSDSLWEKNILDAHNIFYNSGSVGIGTTLPTAMLTVGGSIKVGPTVAPCNNLTEGELRYDEAIHQMRYCNGTAWTTLNGPLQSAVPVEVGCDAAAVSTTTSACPAGTNVRSCGLRLSTNTADPDGVTCSLDVANNVCVATRNQVGACDPGINLDCFCE